MTCERLVLSNLFFINLLAGQSSDLGNGGAVVGGQPAF